MNLVAKFYEPFGAEVISEIQSEITMYGNLIPLLHRLGLPTPPGLENQHQVLRDFIFRFGTAMLLKAMRSNITGPEIEHMKFERLMRQSRTQAASIPATPCTANRMPRTAGTLNRGRPGGCALLTEPLPENGSQAPPRSHGAATSTSAIPRKAWIDSRSYHGYDRRNPSDRRNGPSSRRSHLDTVFRNRRYGGRDRRGLGRRSADSDT